MGLKEVQVDALNVIVTHLTWLVYVDCDIL